MTGVAGEVPTAADLVLQWLPLLRREAARYARWLRIESDDVVNQTVMEVCRQFATFDPDRGSFPAWVKVLTHRTARWLSRERNRSVAASRVVCEHTGDYTRDAGRRSEPADALDSAADARAVDPADEAGENERRQLAAECVDAALAALPASQQAAIRRRFWTDGAEFGRGDREHLHAALATLRERLRRPDGA